MTKGLILCGWLIVTVSSFADSQGFRWFVVTFQPEMNREIILFSV